jgi:hypothetical protein
LKPGVNEKQLYVQGCAYLHFLGELSC